VTKAYQNIIIEGRCDPDDMLSLVSGRILRDTKKALGGKLPRLKNGSRYGYLTLVMEDKKRSKYRCECDCGGAIYLTHPEIHARERLRAGCLSLECQYGAEEVKMWMNPEYALWLQHRDLLNSCPDEVCNEWGGKAYKGTPTAKREQGFENMLEDLSAHFEKPGRKWWVSRENPVLPYSAFNLHFLSWPEVHPFGGRSRYVVHGDTLYSVNSLATLYSLPLKLIQRWKRASENDTQLMEKILRETNE